MRQWFAIRTFLIALAALALAGCGGGSSTNKNVAVVSLGPSTISVVAGEVVSISTSAVNSTGGPVSPTPTITITSSDPKLVTVSPVLPNGQPPQVCAGVWDSAFVVCNGLDALGNPLFGIATLTATANGISSAPITVSIHPPVSFIKISPDPAPGCFSNLKTLQFKAVACSALVTPHDATGPCSPGAADISSKIGSFSWTTTNGTVASVDANGLATSNAPGFAGIVANVGSTSSPATNFKSCMPTQITLHLTTDTAGGTPTEAALLDVNGTTTVQADMVDENGQTTIGAPVTLFSSNIEVAGISGTTTSATITAVSPGGAGMIAACVPPSCGSGINQPVYSNLFIVDVNGASPSTFLYVGSSQSTSVIPFDTSKSPPAAGTAITIPGGLRSIVFTPDGGTAYLAAAGGLVSLNTATNTATTISTNAIGKILAISADGKRLIMSNADFEPDPSHHRLFVYDATGNTVSTFILPGAVGASFTNDGTKAFIAAGINAQNIYVFSPFQTLQKISVGGNALTTAGIAAGPFTFVVNSASGLQVINACDNSLQAATAPTTSTPQLVGGFLDSDTIVTVNQTGLDIDSVGTGAPVSGFCPPTITHSNQFVDFGSGAFTARQLLVPPSIKGHIVVIPKGLNKLFITLPGVGTGPATLPAGATEALSGGITLDGNTAWVGVAGTNTLDRINLTNGADEVQLSLTALKKLDGTQAPPDVVGVRPH